MERYITLVQEYNFDWREGGGGGAQISVHIVGGKVVV